jgi:hypothetical protein
MKQILLTLTLLTSSFFLKAQTINDIPVKDIDVNYVQIVGEAKPLAAKPRVQIDFGQRTKMFSSGKDNTVRDEAGKIVKFNSMMDALNFFSSYGFELVSSYVTPESNADFNNTTHYYILKNTNKKK